MATEHKNLEGGIVADDKRGSSGDDDGVHGGTASPANGSIIDAQEFSYTEDRKIGVTGAVFLILNKMIGTGSKSTACSDFNMCLSEPVTNMTLSTFLQFSLHRLASSLQPALLVSASCFGSLVASLPSAALASGSSSASPFLVPVARRTTSSAHTRSPSI